MIEATPKPILDLEIRVTREGFGVDDVGNTSLPIGSSAPGLYRAELGYGDTSPFIAKLGPLPPKQQLSSLFDPIAKGQLLFDWLFVPPILDILQISREAFMEEGGTGLFGFDPKHLRLRLNLDSRDPALHSVNWETLCEHSEKPIPVSVQTAFSRFLRVRAARGWPVSERPLRMLTVVSNPSGVSDFDLLRFDASMHKQILATAARPLGPVLQIWKTLYNPTRSDLATEMQNPQGQAAHILHFVAHSVVEGDEAFLLLADQNGVAEMVPAEAIRDALKSPSPPYLVFLATPVTQGQTDGAGLLRLAPMLLASGVQAVVVIPGSMQPDQLAVFISSFYDVLLRTGTIDLAVADARQQLFQSSPRTQDWSQPVLYMRTPDGQLFLGLSPDFESSISSVSFGA